MMENINNFKKIKWIHFLKKKFIDFVNVETDPRLQYHYENYFSSNEINLIRPCNIIGLAKLNN
jgi:hypothetical protein